jgi:hypothetical protein
MITTVNIEIETDTKEELVEKCDAIVTLISTLTHEEVTMLSGIVSERPDVLAKAREIRAEAATKDIGFMDLVGYLRSFWKLLKGSDPG